MTRSEKRLRSLQMVCDDVIGWDFLEMGVADDTVHVTFMFKRLKKFLESVAGDQDAISCLRNYFGQAEFDRHVNAAFAKSDADALAESEESATRKERR